MKKILGLSTLALAGVLAFSGCTIGGVSDEEGKAWALDNGYVKAEESYVGTYEFEYLLFSADYEGVANLKVKSCDLLEQLQIDEDYISLCDQFAKITIELTADGYIKSKVTMNGKTETDTMKYEIDEAGKIWMSPTDTDLEIGAVEGVWYKELSVKVENGKILLPDRGSGPYLTAVYNKK